MRCTASNTFGTCERCKAPRPYVIASGFNPDGSFRMLCSNCDRIERPRNQLHLFKGAPIVHAWTEPAPEPEPEPEPRPRAQMSLFI